jgi:rod shape-determining protein MreB and related proteins
LWLKKLVKQVLRDVEPAIAADIVLKGLLLMGGLAQLAGLDEYLAERLGIPVAVVESPAEATIRGLGVIIQNYDAFKRSLAYQK